MDTAMYVVDNISTIVNKKKINTSGKPQKLPIALFVFGNPVSYHEYSPLGFPCNLDSVMLVHRATVHWFTGPQYSGLVGHSMRYLQRHAHLLGSTGEGAAKLIVPAQ